MDNQTIEFSVGQPVTYFPYEHAYKATVTAVRPHIGDFGRPDHRVFYTLSGRDGHRVKVQSPGASISESQYFEPCPEKDKPRYKTKHP